MDIIILLLMIIAFFIALIAVKRGYKEIKMSINIEDKKKRYGYKTISVIHMIAGIIIILGSTIIIVITLSMLLGG